MVVVCLVQKRRTEEVKLFQVIPEQAVTGGEERFQRPHLIMPCQPQHNLLTFHWLFLDMTTILKSLSLVQHWT